jgi:anaerobic selenocysteine-containing dehydrogenase
VVTVENGRATKLRGDKAHPFTQGYLCQKVANYLDRVYHPGRLLVPQKRVGPKGAGAFVPITWDEALTTIADRFRGLIASADGAQTILPFSYSGTLGKIQGNGLDRRFFHLLGASLLDRTICATAGAAGCDLTLGTRAVLDPESVHRAKLIINWGSNTAVTNIHLWTRMHHARKAGSTIVTIDPYRSPTAAKSDWWLPIRPGTDGALALALMHVLFREGWHDADYLDRYCLGGNELRARVLAEYSPEQVAPITGLPGADIEKLARMYGTVLSERGGPAFIRLNYGLQRHRGGGMAVRTVVALPAVSGHWRHVGGGAFLSTSKLLPFANAALERPDLIPPGTRTINMVQLAEALAGELSGPPVRALVVYGANPAAVNPEQSKVRRGLERTDLFTVVHEQFLTDTARYADILLPATTQLEQFDLHYGYGHLYVQLNEPALAPPGQAVCNTELFRRLAAALKLPAELFALSDEQLAEVVLGDTRTGAFAGLTLERLRREGPIRLNLPSDFTPFATGQFATPSGKCELYSPRLAALGLDPLLMYTPPAEDPLTRPELAARFPLQLLSPPVPEFLNSTFANVDVLRRPAGEPSIELHPDDAAARQIVPGQRVRVFNDRGTFVARAQVGLTVRPGVAVALGCWWSEHTVNGFNVNATTSTTLTDFGGGATFFDNLVQVAAVSGIR